MSVHPFDTTCAISAYLSQTLNPPARLHDHSQGQYSDDYREKDEGYDEEKRPTHLGKHIDSPPSTTCLDLTCPDGVTNMS